MMRTVDIPLWLLVLILAFAAVTFASHFLFPSVRWFFRRRMERAVAELNKRLHRPVEPFKLLERHDRIQQLVYDPQVLDAVLDHARSNAIPRNVAFETARRLRRMGAALPDLLILSAHRAPHLPPIHPPLHRLPDTDFDARLADYSGTPGEVLRDAEMMDLFRPLLRRDFAACETYRLTEEPPLPIPALCLGGTEDPDIPGEDLSAWSRHFTDPVGLGMLPGGHFYFHGALSALSIHVKGAMSRLVLQDAKAA